MSPVHSQWYEAFDQIIAEGSRRRLEWKLVVTASSISTGTKSARRGARRAIRWVVMLWGSRFYLLVTNFEKEGKSLLVGHKTQNTLDDSMIQVVSIPVSKSYNFHCLIASV